MLAALRRIRADGRFAMGAPAVESCAMAVVAAIASISAARAADE